VRKLRSIIIAGLIALTGCVDIAISDIARSRPAAQVTLDGAETGSRLATGLMWGDIKQISRTAWAAVESQGGANRLNWSNPSSGTHGTVSSGPIYLIGFNSGEEIEAPLRLDTNPYLVPAAGAYVTNANTNVRLSPSVAGQKVRMLAEGEEVTVLAHEPETDWYLIAVDDRVIGYVFGPLLTRIEGGDLLLAGGEPKQPKLCRELTYSLLLITGQNDAWVNGACREGDEGWRVYGGRAIEVAGL